MPLVLVLALVIVLSVRDAGNRVAQEQGPTHRVVISQEVVQQYIQANNPTSISSADGSRSYEFAVQGTLVIAVCDSNGALLSYTYGTAGGYYESAFTDGELSEISHTVMYQDTDGSLRQKTVRSEPEDMTEIRRYLTAFSSGEISFDEAYREIDLLMSINGRDYRFTRIGGVWCAAPE
ncbi:MAG: hypothetical protein PUA86_04510 [Clostridiaceae bacterium]|nr:hypothetical protein [Clostridiaceae bacterium]